MNNKIEYECIPIDYMIFLNYIYDNAHTLIAGTTGSGKSELIKNLLAVIFSHTPNYNQVFIFDPKKIDYYKYKDLPHVVGYCDGDNVDYYTAFEWLVNEMQRRLEGYKNGKTWNHLFIIIDEYPDIKQKSKRSIPLIEELTRLSRAVNMHVIIATQRPTKDIINGTISANMSVKIALRTATAQESRNIIAVSGAEDLPLYGQCLIRYPQNKEIERWNIPLISDTLFETFKRYWNSYN